MHNDDKQTAPEAAQNKAKTAASPEEDREKLKDGNKAFPGSSTFGGSGGKMDKAQNDHAPSAGYKSPNLGSSSVILDQDEAAAMNNKESGTSEKK